MKNSKQGNMYPWIDECWCPLRGACPHQCSYCYVPSTAAGRCGLYSGPLTLSGKSMRWMPRPETKTVFVGYMNDLFAGAMPTNWIDQVLEHCRTFAADRVLVFQTKNPRRALRFLPQIIRASAFAGDWLLGVTLETNRPIPAEISRAPSPFSRFDALLAMAPGLRAEHLFLTIEPIMCFDPVELGSWICRLRPKFVNIGADSKGHHLPEPSAWKVRNLIEFLLLEKIEIREKHNLGRLLSETDKGQLTNDH
jgi:hypothetical protein